MLPKVTQRLSQNFDHRRDVTGRVKISMLVLHYTGMQSCEEALERLCNRDAKVSAHLLIDEDGSVYKLVEEDQRAWHAGRSYWRGVSDINSVSVGIELVNPGHEFGYQDFPGAQIKSLTAIAQDITERHNIPPTGVVGHADIAPGRKADPGERFPWELLASEGIGLWPEESEEKLSTSAPWDNLASIGYAMPGNSDCGGDILDPITGEKDVILAFQQRFLAHHLTGSLDDLTKGRISAVAATYS
jgi:N-acetylmuramoyl-L-alanine amidase